MKETTISYKIRKYLEGEGYIVIRLRATSEAGWPDLLVIAFMRIVFIETKTPIGKLSELQKEKHFRLKLKGIKTIVASSIDDVERFNQQAKWKR